MLNESVTEIALTHGGETATLTYVDGNNWKFVDQAGNEKTLTGSTLKFKRVNDAYQLELSPVKPPLTKMPTIFAFIAL